MKKEPTDEQKAEYDKFMNEQFKILTGHFTKIMLRCYNKFNEIIFREEIEK